MNTIRVLVAEPHEMIRKSLISAIEGYHDLEFIAEADDGFETLRQCEALKPDVILMGLYLRELDGLETTRLIRQKPHRPHIIMIDGLWGEEHERSALAAGIDVYFSLETSVEDIVSAIRNAPRSPHPPAPSTSATSGEGEPI